MCVVCGECVVSVLQVNNIQCAAKREQVQFT